MKRLVYSPRTEAYVKTDYGVYDLSPYITRGSIQRVLDQVSRASLTIRNPKFHFTEFPGSESGTGPLLHPMDPIVITLTRIKDRPIQVFTGFLDSTPYLQLFPGTITLNASCTLKKLQYTYADPGLTFFNDWLVQHGWETQEGFGAVNPTAATPLKDGNLQDSGFGKLLFAFLTEVGGWNENDVFIEALPDSIVQVVSDLFAEAVDAGDEAQRELDALLHRIIGTGSSLGGGLPVSNTSGGAGGQTATAGGWIRVGATYEGLDGATGSCGHAVGGMAFADLLCAGANANLKSQSVGAILNLGAPLPCGTKLEVRKPGATRSYVIEKNDVGSGQAGNPHYKIDLQSAIADKLGGRTTQDIEVKRV